MAHDVLHMVCLGTHPCGSYRIIVPVYNLVFWVFEALPCPLPIVVHSSSFFLFSQDQRKNILPLLYGCLRPFLLPSSNHDILKFVFNILMKIKGRICPCFSSMIALPLPSTKSSFTLRSPIKHPVGAKNDRFKHPWKERKVNEKLTNTYLHTRPFRGENWTDNSWNDSWDPCRTGSS